MSSKNKGNRHLGAETVADQNLDANIESTGDGANIEGAVDFNGNPEGTIYLHDGTATHEDYSHEELKHLPTAPAESGLEYDSDGQFFKLPEDYGKVIQAFKEEIAGYRLAITKAETAIEGAKALISGQPEDMQHLFQGPITSQQIKIDSDKTYMAAAKAKLDDYMLSLERPSVRNAKRELAEVQAEILTLKTREAALLIQCGATGANLVTKGEPSEKKSISSAAVASTEEQKKNYAEGLAALGEGGTQGRLIVEAVKKGWKNAKIGNFYGIAEANVPGPKNKFLRSEEGLKWQAANPGVVDTIGVAKA